MDVLTLDGSHGEGGGQILRTALSLSIITARHIRLVNIRTGRPNPGLMAQHLSAVRAAAAISGAAISGDCLGSTNIVFAPSHPSKSGSYVFDVAEIAGQVAPVRQPSSCRRWQFHCCLQQALQLWSCAVEPMWNGRRPLMILRPPIFRCCGA